MTPSTDTERADFEAHMLKLSPCVRLYRHTCDGGDKYRTVTVQRNWELWQAARALPAGLEPDRYMDARGYTVTKEFLDSDESSSDYRLVYTEPLFTAAQVLAMGRVPPGWASLASRCAVLLEAYAVQIEGEWGMGRSFDRLKADGELPGEIDELRAMLATAPRPQP